MPKAAYLITKFVIFKISIVISVSKIWVYKLNFLITYTIFTGVPNHLLIISIGVSHVIEYFNWYQSCLIDGGGWDLKRQVIIILRELYFHMACCWSYLLPRNQIYGEHMSQVQLVVG